MKIKIKFWQAQEAHKFSSHLLSGENYYQFEINRVLFRDEVKQNIVKLM